jgi:O-antigen/teichoic acid export membrane protein
MQFRKFFLSSLGGMAVSAVVGIAMAYFGFGIWALVAQNLTNVLIDTLILLVTVEWRPKLQFSFRRLRALFGFGWKVMLSALLDTVYEEFRTLYVGALHTANDLSFFDRGKQFPYLIIDNVNTSITSVLFPAIASRQKDPETVRGMTRRAMKISAYILSPMLLGLAAVAEPLVELVLTEKWLPCVPFLQILCINCVLTPLHTANTQAILAMGRSDIALKLNIAKKGFGFLTVVLLTPISVTAMALGGVATGVFSLLLNILPNSRLLGYGYRQQLRDVFPAWALSGIMFALVRLVGLLQLPLLPELALMVLVGMGSYVMLSALFRVESFRYLLNMLKPILNKLKR